MAEQATLERIGARCEKWRGRYDLEGNTFHDYLHLIARQLKVATREGVQERTQRDCLERIAAFAVLAITQQSGT